MSPESTTGMQELVLNSVIRTLLKLLTIIQYCDGLCHIMEFVLCPASLKIHQPLDSNEKKKDQEEGKTFLISPHPFTDTFSKLHFLLCFTCIMFAFHISATEQ